MFIGQKRYIENMLEKKMPNMLISTGFSNAVRWLHNSLNMCHMRKDDNSAGGFSYWGLLSDYKRKRALYLLSKYAGADRFPTDFVSGTPPYSKCASVFYYAARIIRDGFPENCNRITDADRIVYPAISVNFARLREDHNSYISEKSKRIVKLVTTLSNEYESLKGLLYPRHVEKALQRRVKDILERRN